MNSQNWKVFGEEILKAYLHQKKNRGEFEIEFQFRSPPKFNDSSFYSEISLKEFNRVNEYFSRTGKAQETLIRDRNQGNVRESTNMKTNERKIYYKNRLWESYGRYGQPSELGALYAEELNTRATISTESPMEYLPRDFNPTTIRIKNRKSFLIQDVGRLDLTLVDQSDLVKGKNSQKYECELEVTLESLKSSIALFKVVNSIYRSLLGSLLPYTNSDRNKIYQYVADILHLKSPIIPFTILPEARDLEMKDMVYGGLIGNTNTKYCVTHKADGIRRWIVITSNEIWAMMPGSSDLNLIFRSQPKDRFLLTSGYIFDGELLEKSNRWEEQNTHYVFYIFDVVCQNKIDIRNEPDYEKRMGFAQTYKKPDDPLMNKIFKLKVKSFKPLSGVNLFFLDMKEMFLEQERVKDYKKDGFMFIPMNTVYNPYNSSDSKYENSPKIFERSLVEYPDICKWKPPQKRTIDFVVSVKQVSPTEKEIILESDYVDPTTNERKRRIFVGSDINPLNQKRIDHYHPLIQNVPTGTIIEFYWNPKIEQLVPERIRDDKTSPNKYQTALAVWKNIFDGISEETMKGQTFQLMRKYHNRIKRNLYDTTDSCRNHKVLLDIGSGRGGDISKWSNYELVFAVEPNAENRKEFMERLSTSTMKNKVVIIPTGGEDYETITKVISEKYGEKVSCVSIMLSFSFFHGKAREGLRKTLEMNMAIGGKVMIFTVNGDLVKEMFQPASGDYKETSLRFLDAETVYNPKDGTLYVDMPNSIVSKQFEVPPKLTELFKEWNNFLPLNLSRADKEKFLNPDEKAFSNMYSSFTLTFMKNPIQETEIERIVPFTEDWVGISVYPTDYLYLSSILKAVDPKYQDNNSMSFRSSYVVQLWEEIKSTLTREELESCSFPWRPDILAVFAQKMNLKILYLKDKFHQTFGESENKIILTDQYILARRDERGNYQTLF